MIMASKGGTSHLKRLAAPKFMPIARKRFVWLARPMPGAHPIEESVPLITLMRDVLGYADNAREARRMIRNGEVLVDGRAIKRERFPVGLMDVISLPKLKKNFRVLIDNRQRMKLQEIGEDEVGYKLCRVERKSTLRGNRVQLGFHDGRNALADNSYKVGDTVKLEVPTQKIAGTYRLEPAARCLIIKGKHAGKVATIVKIHPRTSRRDPEVTMRNDGEEFTTVKKYLFVIGKEMQ